MENINAEVYVEPMAEHNFQIVKQLRLDINNIFTEMDDKLNILNELYQELVKTHHDKNYMIGLDAFHFQNKLLHMECDNMKNVFNFIDNRIYCEYYKLHRMLFDFIGKEIKEKAIVDKLMITYKKYPSYKDLEPTKIYDFNITLEINNAIQNAIQELKEYLVEKKQELIDKKKRSEMGINIHTIIHEQMYNNIILEERIHMFENYLHTFISHHSKYFSRLAIKLKLMMGIVNEDFNLKKKSVDKNTVRRAVKSIAKTVEGPSDTTSVSSASSASSTPKSSMNEVEETNVRLWIGDTDACKGIQTELNTILYHISESDPNLREV
jgi:hypothetical protein